jgi:hypothetical protein
MEEENLENKMSAIYLDLARQQWAARDKGP